MDTLFTILLTIHIIGGVLGLICGTINIIRKKGDKTHKLVGKGFLYGMLTAGAASFILAILHPSPFLFMVGVFSVYLVGSGQRYLSLKELNKGQKPLIIDYALSIFMFIAGIAFICIGISRLIDGNEFGIVYIVFAFLGLRFVHRDSNNFRGKVKYVNYWLMEHIGRMSGGFIASVTASLVVNGRYFPFIPDALLWLLPTILIVPLIVSWSIKSAVKFKNLN
jgi:uncharacterized membrane protein